ncbi:beta-glucosidase [Bifidobacterium actinocoloniiforme DSM 22766]|uniref:Exo-alpha-(1->6)-L-arabinopyranosidase n=2 Tax=Bifidobacterium actinocoloniiforme TaxID=638619 RepID=A0A086YZL4_9BIFI|nr:beta-glucosidase [Bifidobacterium actinocoloniiforme DSM 22766]KFI39714.1 beta-glucosidase [Bifidobacterium actinocoloniiforme DSM 22766]
MTDTNASRPQPAFPKASDLSLEEKASLTSGGDAWHLQGIESKGVPGYMITDGPHGLRKTEEKTGAVDLNESVPATCFPPAAGMASSWNPQLVEEVGRAMGQECIQEQVAVILGPGVNIKRNPLGGRCFEFWSEDPFLAGHEAVGIVSGVQSQGVGTSLKHFAVNNQETDRLRISARVSQRALREIYLPAFEYIVKTAQPWTVMCAYNQINGVHASQDHWLLTDVLRKEWGFTGIVMSDWGADHDRVASLNAGLNLEMPPSYTDDRVVSAARDGSLPVDQLDSMAQGMIDLAAKAAPAMSRTDYRYSVDEHRDVARRAARESAVLLKNEGALLPLDPNGTVAVIGEFARTPRYQGGGSSHITPTAVSSFLDAAGERGAKVDFAPGFTLDDEPQDESLTSQAVESARKAKSVLLFLGLPEQEESEGADRTNLDLPAKQLDLLKAVSAVNPHVAVVLSNGSVVSIAPWRDQAQAILEGWLLGQDGGRALADLIYGDYSPSGKLAQTIPMDLADDPTMLNWPGEEGHVDYGEGVYVGYRYYDSFHKPVAYPFGFGLSYASFELSDVHVTARQGNTATVSVRVTNTSDRDAAETVQVYVAPGKAKVARPSHELKAFRKVFLKAGESQEISIDLDERAFAYWSETHAGWRIEAGDYGVEVGTSSRDIAATVTISLPGDGKRLPLTEWSTMDEWREDPVGGPIMERMEALGRSGELPELPIDNASAAIFLASMPINSLFVLMGGNGSKLTNYLLDNYAQATHAA